MRANLEAKKVLVEEIKDKFKNATSLVFVDYSNLTVSEDTQLRKSCREANVTYKVYKNRLMKKALDDLGITDYDPKNLEGSTSVAIGSDEVMPAKLIYKAITDFNKMNVKFGVVNGKVVDKSEIEALSKIPSRDVLIAMLLGQLNAPIAGLVRALDAIAKKN